MKSMFENLYQSFLEKDQKFVQYCEGLKDQEIDISFVFSSLDAIHILLENLHNIGTSQKEKLAFLEQRVPYYLEMRLIQEKLKQTVSSSSQDLLSYSRLFQLVTMYDKLKNTIDFNGNFIKQIEIFHKVQDQLNSIYQGLFATNEFLEAKDAIPRLKDPLESDLDYQNYVQSFYQKEEKGREESLLDDRKEFEENLASQFEPTSSKEDSIASLFEAPSSEIEDPVSLIVSPKPSVSPTKEELESYKEFVSGFYHSEPQVIQSPSSIISPKEPSILPVLPLKNEKKEETPEELLAIIKSAVAEYKEKTGVELFPKSFENPFTFQLVRSGLSVSLPEEPTPLFEPQILIGDLFQVSFASNAYFSPALGSDGAGFTKPLYAPSFERTVLESYFLDEKSGAIRIATSNELLLQYGNLGLTNIGVKGEDGYYKLSDVRKVSPERGL